MPRTINHIELLGRTGAEPEMRSTNSGTAVTRVRLATDRPARNGDGETDWHTVICWGKLAEAVNSYVKKGDRLYVSGRLIYRSYDDKQGEKRHQSEIHAQEVVFLEPRSEAVGTNGGETSPAEDLPF